MNPTLFSRLSLMMFLQFFVWGAWYVTVPNYMAELGMSDHIYWAYSVSPIGAIISPFFLGFIADRYFPTEKVLGVMHLLSGIFVFVSPFFAEGGFYPATLFIVFLGLHMLCYMPTMGLANTMAFHNLSDQEQEFPYIRVSGTVGWIVAGVFVSYGLGADTTAIPLYVAGVSGVLMGVYSFTLPHVPPPAKGQETSIREVLGLDALSRLSSPSFNIFLVASLLICIPLSIYYSYAPVFVNAVGFADTAAWMSLGQVSEAVFVLLMPTLFLYFGVKWMLLTGMLAWVVRYGLFAAAAPGEIAWMVLLGVILHGVAYDFFFIAGQIYVDEKASEEIRGQGQGLIVFLTYGVGMFIGQQIGGPIFNNIVTGTVDQALGQWQTFWYVPALVAAVVSLFFLFFFNEKVTGDDTAAAAEAQPSEA